MNLSGRSKSKTPGQTDVAYFHSLLFFAVTSRVFWALLQQPCFLSESQDCPEVGRTEIFSPYPSPARFSFARTRLAFPTLQPYVTSRVTNASSSEPYLTVVLQQCLFKPVRSFR